jgi:hypothetical protein
MAYTVAAESNISTIVKIFTLEILNNWVDVALTPCTICKIVFVSLSKTFPRMDFPEWF